MLHLTSDEKTLVETVQQDYLKSLEAIATLNRVVSTRLVTNGFAQLHISAVDESYGETAF